MIDFSCQDRLPMLCTESRKVLEHTTITIVGMGALGTHSAELLVRMGAKNLVFFDDDDVEASNLHRQTLFTAEDIGKKKVTVAQKRLLAITPLLIETHECKVTKSSQLKGADIILDCTDNTAARLIINDAKIPWVHAAVIDTRGEVMTITKNSKNYRDFLGKRKAQDDCSEQGVLPSAVAMTSALQVSMALKLFLGKPEINCFYRLDAWDATLIRYEL